MKIPEFINEDQYEDLIDDEILNNCINSTSKISLPFLKVNIEKIKDSNNLSYKVKNSKSLINSQTDKLLEAGFEGDEEDFKRIYKKIEPIKIKKIIDSKERKLNKLLVKDDYLGPIKLTKIKEFNLTIRQRNKLLDKLNQFKTMKENSNNNQYILVKRNSINNINNNNSKLNHSISANNVSSAINRSKNNINYNISTSNKNIFNNSTSSNFYNNNLNSLKGAYFLYKNNSDLGIWNNHKFKNKSINFNKFITLRDILTNTSHNIININAKLKHYIRKNNLTRDLKTVSTKRKNNKSDNKIKTFYKIKKNKNEFYEVLDSLKKRDKDQILKQIKKDDGVSNQNIWIKKSTANLVSFGKSFQTLADDLFYKEHKRIISKYPEIEKDADLPVPELNKDDKLKKMHRIKLERNSRIIKDLTYNNKLMFIKLNKRMKKSN